MYPNYGGEQARDIGGIRRRGLGGGIEYGVIGWYCSGT
jgi:hypothetical protein